jgi:hypothetical protein
MAKIPSPANLNISDSRALKTWLYQLWQGIGGTTTTSSELTTVKNDVDALELTVSDIQNDIALINNDINGLSNDIDTINDVLEKSTSTNYIIVDSLSDLPTPVSGVITLADNYTYLFVTVIDLLGSRLVCGQNTTILGTSSENCRIKSTGLIGSALISSAWSMPLRHITIEASIALNLDASANANQALDWFGVNFTDCATIGTIKSYTNFIMADSAFLNSGNLTFDGTIGTIGFTQCLFDTSATSTGIILPSSLTVSRRFRIIYSSFVALAGETSLNVSTSASIPVDGYILDTVNFSGGGTYIAGVQHNDNKSLFVSNKNISNSASIAFMTMQANTTATTIAATGTRVKISGTTTLQAISQKFTMPTNNRLTYNGAITRDFLVQVTASLEAGNGQELGMYIAKNGTVQTTSTNMGTTGGTGRADNNACQMIISLSTNDYIEVFVSNETAATNITATYLSVIVESVN